MADYDESIRKIGDLATLLQTILEQSRDHMGNCHSSIDTTNSLLGSVATDSTLTAVKTILESVVVASKIQVAGTVSVGGVATEAKQDTIITALAALNTLLTTANSLQTTANATLSTISTTLSTISTTLTGIKAKTDGMNYNGLNLRVTGLL